jgi:catalase
MANDTRLTNNFGAPVPDNEHSLTAGERGPILLQDYLLIEKLAHFDRERIPERVVHAKGRWSVRILRSFCRNVSYTRAHLFAQEGRRTPVPGRFSTVGGEKGSADADRDPRGFAIKFYTEEGNYDLVGNNTPVFFIRDPFKFPDMVHTHKRNPQSNLKDPDAFWDFFSRSPESTHMVTILFSDRGIPRSYREMHGFGSHTFKWINAKGKACWVKYHFKTETGIANLTSEEAAAVAAKDPDNAARDLFQHIQGGASQRGRPLCRSCRTKMRRRIATIHSTLQRSGATETIP